IEGRAVQIAPPQEIYVRPATLAVARFLGYRNVIEGALRGGAGRDVRVARAERALRGTLMGEAPASGAVIAAIRREVLATGEASTPHAWPAAVAAVEYQGSDWLLELVAAGDVRLFVRRPAPVPVGTSVHVAAPADRVLIYGGGARD